MDKKIEKHPPIPEDRLKKYKDYWENGRSIDGIAEEVEEKRMTLEQVVARILDKLGRLHQFAEDSRLDSWLYRIVYTRWIDRLRRQKTRQAHLVLMTDEKRRTATDGTAADARIHAAMDIRTALNSLPEEHRAAMVLVVVEGYGYKEAATILELPVGTVASRVARARGMLAKMMTHREEPHLKTVAQTQGK